MTDCTSVRGSAESQQDPKPASLRSYAEACATAAATQRDDSAGGKLRILDLFCGAGGAARGYHDVGFDVFGVDLNPQPNYPYEFAQGDAITLLENLVEHGFRGIDAVHASPPCQGYSNMSNCRPGLADEYPKLIGPVRELLQASGLPYVIENVPLARSDMREPVMLCGFMFGRELYRHRLFETNWGLPQPDHDEHTIPASKAGHWRPGTVMSVAGHVAPVAHARRIMEMDWTTREERVLPAAQARHRRLTNAPVVPCPVAH